MNLTISIKHQLLIDVLKDQFSDEFKRIKEDFQKEFDKEIASHSSHKAYVEVLSVLERHGVKKDFSLNTTNYFTPLIKNKNLSFCSGLKVGVHKKDTTILFILFASSCRSNICSLASTSKWNNTYLDVCPNSKLGKLILKYEEFIRNVDEISSSLYSVLMSCKTVKKLQENTKVFDPFLPAEKKKNQLIPVEALCRINELKTPKKKCA